MTHRQYVIVGKSINSATENVNSNTRLFWSGKLADVDIDRMRNQFNEKFQELVSAKDSNCFFMSTAQYDEYMNSVVQAKQSTSLTTLQRRRLERFDVCSNGGIQKLIVPVKEGESSIIYFVKNEEMFDVLYGTHISVGHGGKHKMLTELKKKYKNVTQEVVLLFLKHCVACAMKQNSKKMSGLVKPIMSDQMDNRCQVDLIDMHSSPDGAYKFIMVYQDHSTKFVQLRALTSKSAVEVAKQLLDIFCIFGAPEILQSDNGREFVSKIIEELRSMWKGLHIVHGKPCHSQSQESVNRANQRVEQLLATWMATENSTKWSEGLKFVQFMKNREVHDDTKVAPYKAMFGIDAKFGLSTSALLNEVFESIRTEEDLQNILQSISPVSSEIQDENLKRQAKKMKTRSNAKFRECRVEDTVIPDVDTEAAELCETYYSKS